ncbi:hypothetical protein EDB19DRAFT_1909581 [Suillus lakei]|nr:hypothetical protein EDB19DRAFT_1909581 [Suillus lakei]
MHFVALVALAVIASTVPGLAAPAPNSHREVTHTGFSPDIFPNVYERSRVMPLGTLASEGLSHNTKRQETTSIGNELIEGTSSNNGERRAEVITWNDYGVTEDTSSNDAKRQAEPVIPWTGGIAYGTSGNNSKR